jgi:hypothetical protein
MTNRRLTILIAVMLLLGGALWFDHGWWSGSEQTLPGAVAAPTPDTGEYTERRRLRATASELAAVNPLGDWPAEALAEVLDRPLFNPSRRAYKPPPEPEPEPEAPEPVVEETLKLALIGVLLGENGRFAMLKEDGSGKILRLKEGQSLDDWTLAEVRLRDVVLVRGEERKTLKLFDKAAQKTPDAAAGQSKGGASRNENNQEDEDEDE